ncbi:MAG: hypothetical protein ABJG80_20660 [Paracoccaceae bacterium]
MNILAITNFTKVDGLPAPSRLKVLARETALVRVVYQSHQALVLSRNRMGRSMFPPPALI